GDETAVPLGKTGTLPDVAKEHFLGQIDELGDGSAYLVPGRGGRGRFAGHGDTLLMGRGDLAAARGRSLIDGADAGHHLAIADPAGAIASEFSCVLAPASPRLEARSSRTDRWRSHGIWHRI